MTDDLLETASAAVRAYWEGSDKSKLDLRQCMTDLRCAVHAEQKKRAQDETARITKP